MATAARAPRRLVGNRPPLERSAEDGPAAVFARNSTEKPPVIEPALLGHRFAKKTGCFPDPVLKGGKIKPKN